ncbi:NACHT domain-containing protein [Nodosilinea sp. AN01ver1]|uniref:NACHT domain-containing protein n=1 Tax=Nodosilinea sp. AN01ver1 TaxID=3423362 RepID=UPI003D3223F2
MTGFEPLIGAAAAGLGGLITGLVKDKGTETLKKLDWDIGRNLALRKALKEYVSRYIKRHGTLKVACVRMDNPVRLDKIYTAVQLLDRSALRYFESEDALQEQYRQSGSRGFNVTQAVKKPGLQVANEQQYLMVLGGPGVGKSTFLRKVGLEALQTLSRRNVTGSPPGNLRASQDMAYQHPCIPVMLELRQFNSLDRSIKTVIAEELETCGFPETEALTELFLNNGQLLVLLDGLDEVPSATLNHAITEIGNLVDRYSDNRYIASCRVAAYTFGGFQQFKDVAMAAFEDEQIEQFIENWFQKEWDTETKTAERCWKMLNSSDYRAAKELAQTPLLLTLLCVVYDEFQNFPKKRHALYGEALDVLLRKWASEKRIQRNPIYQELSAELELDMLAEIAYTSFADDQFFFAKERLVEQIREFLVENLNAPSHLDTETVLKEIEVQQGILVERARNAYSFSHLTFQEYLAAKCIVDNQKINQLVRDHATDKHWREIFILVAGLAPGKRGADEFLLAIEQKAQTYIKSKNLRLLFTWAETNVDLSRNIKAFEKRALAVFLARILARDINIDLDLDLALDLASVLALALAVDMRFSHYLSHILDLARIRIRDHALKLDHSVEIVRKYEKLQVFQKDAIDSVLSSMIVISSLNKEFHDSGSYHKKRRYFLDNTLECFSCNLNFPFKQPVFSAQETRQFVDYFYTLELMIRCKEAAVRVSPQVWEGIESRMVTVPE